MKKCCRRTASTLIKAQKYKKKAKQAGFYFETIEQSIQNVQKKLQEFEHSLQKSQQCQQKEFGDLLLALVNVSIF